VLVCIVNSVRGGQVARSGAAGLLIADECHRYGSRFRWRLGLSATYARKDDGHVAWLEPYFGGPCFALDYRRALAEGVTAPFRVALVGCRFGASQAVVYQGLSVRLWQARSRLIRSYGLLADHFGEFLKRAAALAHGRGAPDVMHAAQTFLAAFHQRRALLAETPAKMEALAKVAGAVRAAGRTIAFTQTIAGAQLVARQLGQWGVAVATVHSGLGRQERRHVLERFRTGGLQAIVAPKVLDEGVDVPEADLALIVAASQTRLQMIQRMGRVLRRKADGRLARFAILYVEGTAEDPASGAHRDFLDEVTSVADEHPRTFGAAASAAETCAYLQEIASPRPVRPPRWAGEPGGAPT